jgi:hypothetical protein
MILSGSFGHWAGRRDVGNHRGELGGLLCFRHGRGFRGLGDLCGLGGLAVLGHFCSFQKQIKIIFARTTLVLTIPIINTADLL